MGASDLVTVVMPSFQQGRFLRAAIDSVLAQTWPHVELLVFDGGSTDGSVEILRSYGERVTWVSEPDRGQSHAINKGFVQGRGRFITWLNSDDELAPDAAERAVEVFRRDPAVGLVYGRGGVLDEERRSRGPFPGTEPFHAWRLLHFLDFILQPAALFRRSALERAGLPDEGLHYALDWDLEIRLAAVSEVHHVPETIGWSREYGETKTATGGWRRIREQRRMIAGHTGRAWTPGVLCYALDTLGTELRAALPRRLHAAVDRLVGRWSRRIVTRLPLHPDGWLGPRGRLAAPRRWGGAAIELEAHRLPAGGRFPVRLAARGLGPGASSGTTSAALEIERAGDHPAEIDFPPGESPWVEIAVDSGFSFRPPGDARRLALRCRGLGPR